MLLALDILHLHDAGVTDENLAGVVNVEVLLVEAEENHGWVAGVLLVVAGVALGEDLSV